MQPVPERGSIDKSLTFDVGLMQLSFIPVCSPNTYNISVKLYQGFALLFCAFHFSTVSERWSNKTALQNNTVYCIQYHLPIVWCVSVHEVS